MPDRKPSALIGDILSAMGHIESYTSGLSYEAFLENFMAVEACLYNIQVIGEAVSKIPEEIKSENTGIPWILIRGMRNRLIHDYFGTDYQLVWNVIKNELPLIKPGLQSIQLILQKSNR